MKVQRVEDLRSWKLAYNFKLAVYELLKTTELAKDMRLRQQLRDAAASAVSQIEEGFARFYPRDFARMVVSSRASIRECCGHLRDAVDRGLLTQQAKEDADTLANTALREISGLLDYLQSPEAETNAKRIKEQRMERRRLRRTEEQRGKDPDTPPSRRPKQD